MQGETKGEWGFKSLKQMVKALFRQGRHAEMMDRYKELLNYLHVVTKNQSEKVILSGKSVQYIFLKHFFLSR
jgi:COP9 signalosome complex subunit 2